MKRPAKKNTFKPTMEALETRWCPATTVSPLQNGIVTITGDDTTNTVAITQNDNLNRLTIQVENGLTGLGDTRPALFTFASDQVTDMVINLKGGNDQLTYKLGGGSNIGGKRIKVDLGSGDDVATFNFADNGAGGLASVSGLNLDIQAGAGKDQVDAFFGHVGADDRRSGFGGVTLTGNMGYGDDHFYAELRDIAIPDSPANSQNSTNGNVVPVRPATFSTMHIDMEDMNDLVIRDPLRPTIILGTILGGNDDFRVTCGPGVLQGEDSTGLSLAQGLGVTLKGGDGNDNLQFQYDGDLDGGLTLLLDGQGGADTVTADITMDPASAGIVNATVLGGNGNDILRLRITNPSPATVQGLLDGGDGFDNFNKTSNVTVQNCEIGVFV